MRRSFSLLASATLCSVLSGGLVACSSSSSGLISPPVQDAGGDTTPPKDTGPQTPDISGTTEISLKVMDETDKPMSGVPSRIENAQGGFLESTTGADGTVKFKVDSTKGPFDITAAKKDYTAVSVLNITASVANPVYLLPLKETTTTPPKSFQITGNISGKQKPENTVQVDAYAFSTVVTADGNYSTEFSKGEEANMQVFALEVDASGNLINGMATTSKPRTEANMTVDVALPSPAKPPTKTSVKAKFPSEGCLKESEITEVVDFSSDDSFLGEGILVKESGKGGQAYVGVATTKLPASGFGEVVLQHYDGEMKPDLLTYGYRAKECSFQVNTRALTANSTVELPTVTNFKLSGTNLGDAKFDLKATGVDGIFVYFSPSSSSDKTSWRFIVQGTELSNRGVPHLPSSVKLADVGILTNASPSVTFVKVPTGSPKPWEPKSTGEIFVFARGKSLPSAGR